MTWYAIHDADGVLVSIGTVLADPMPGHLTAVALSDEDADILVRQGGRWDPDTRSVVVVTVEPEPDPIADLAATIAAQQAQIDALLDALGGA
jgi:riboflavin biosynthesis pyrimidine reductase